MFCKNCGKDIGESVICPECGTDNSTKETPVAPVVKEDVQPKVELKQKSNICGILGFAWSFFMPLVGLILGIVGLAKAKEYTDPNRGLSTAAIIISAIELLAIVLYFVLLVALIVPVAPQLMDRMQEAVKGF